MRLIKPSFEIMTQQSGLEGIYGQIELAGRTCYKSEGNAKYRWYSKDNSRWIDENFVEYESIKSDYPIKGESLTAKEFVDRMIKSGHGAMLEHGTVYLYLPPNSPITFYKYRNNKHSCYKEFREKENSASLVHTYVTTNYRVLVENKWLEDLKYLCEPTEYHERRITVRFICDKGVSHEFVRHRIFSFAQESTRYCNYSKAKFGHELTFIIPCWLDCDEQIVHNGDFERSGSGSIDFKLFIDNLLHVESTYFNLLKEGWKPQKARAVLPSALKTELVMTGFVSDWKHFFKLRAVSNAHPQAYELACPLFREFLQREIINQD